MLFVLALVLQTQHLAECTASSLDRITALRVLLHNIAACRSMRLADSLMTNLCFTLW